MTKCIGALSAYVPASEPGRAADFEDPLKHYILETTAREARKVRVRQLGIVLALIGGLAVSQWPIAFSSANAVPTVVQRAEAAAGDSHTISLERLAFAGGFQNGF